MHPSPTERERAAPPTPSSATLSFTRRVLIVTAIVVVVVLAAGLIWYAGDVLLLVFAGILLAVLLRSVSNWLSAHTPLSSGWSLALVGLLLLALLIGGGGLLAASLGAQVVQLLQQLPGAAEQLMQQVQQTPWGQWLLTQTPPPEQIAGGQANVAGTIAGFFSTSVGALANVVIVVFLGVYLAADPQLYVNGIVRLFPKRRRHRVRDVLHTVGYTLRWWLLGQLVTMAVVGTLTTLGLWLLGVPLAPALGLIAALCEFVPNIGPVVAAVPGILLALSQSPTLALAVAALYVAIQTFESYVLYPLVQQRAVALPPALTILAIVLLGVLAGGLGLILATPLTAVVLVLVKLLYVEDLLGDDLDVAGEPG